MVSELGKGPEATLKYFVSSYLTNLSKREEQGQIKLKRGNKLYLEIR